MFDTAMILAGGLGTRFAEYTENIPKPMIKANDKPLLDHIISIYSKFYVNNIVVLGGYKIEKIIEHYEILGKKISNTDNVFSLANDVKVTVLDTGLKTMTGGRLKLGLEYIKDNNIYLTYGDGIADINIKNLSDFYLNSKKIATVTAVRPPARFGSLEISNNIVTKFGEKDNATSGWINGGFFVFNRKILDYIESLETVLEKEPLENVTKDNELSAYSHNGFWQPCDTIRELEVLEQALKKGLV